MEGNTRKRFSPHHETSDKARTTDSAYAQQRVKTRNARYDTETSGAQVIIIGGKTMNKLIYPAIFHPEPEVGGYSVYFPDLLGCVTEGDTLQEAFKMAEDALGLYLYSLKEDGESFPLASNPSNLKPKGDDFTALVEWDEVGYLKRVNTKSVKKTLTIPSWLDTLAKERNINFSRALQKALMEALDIRDIA